MFPSPMEVWVSRDQLQSPQGTDRDGGENHRICEHAYTCVYVVHGVVLRAKCPLSECSVSFSGQVVTEFFSGITLLLSSVKRKPPCLWLDENSSM